jgi:spore coat protein U-like protein
MVHPITSGAARAESGTAVTTDFAVEARVLSTCAVSSLSPRLDFGSMDVFSAPDTMTGEAAVTFSCTADASFNIHLGNGKYPGVNLRRMKHSSQDKYIDYRLSANPASGIGGGAAYGIQSIISGIIKKSDFEFMAAVPAGDYEDTVLISVDAN